MNPTTIFTSSNLIDASVDAGDIQLDLMNCLTDHETACWLKDRCVTQSPYDSLERPPYYIQCHSPTARLQVEEFVSALCDSERDSGEFLIHVTDWSLYTGEQMDEFNAFRPLGDTRPLIDAAGHLLSIEETELAARLFGIATKFGWSSYLYFSGDVATLYNWEGELYDFWSRDRTRLDVMKDIIGNLKLDVTCDG